MAKIPNARNYCERINRGSQGSTPRSQYPVTAPAQAGLWGRIAAVLACMVVHFLIVGSMMGTLVGGFVLAILAFAP